LDFKNTLNQTGIFSYEWVGIDGCVGIGAGMALRLALSVEPCVIWVEGIFTALA
jgi:hypothetical protein